jgi:hypothetical protein
MARRSPRRCGSLTRRPRPRQTLQPVEPAEGEWRLAEPATGIDRGWDAASRLGSTLEFNHLGRAARRRNARRPAGTFPVLRAPWKVERPGRLTHPAARAFACQQECQQRWLSSLSRSRVGLAHITRCAPGLAVVRQCQSRQGNCGRRTLWSASSSSITSSWSTWSLVLAAVSWSR